MVERRSLTEGITPLSQAPAVDPAVERQFVHGIKATTTTPAAASPHSRVPISTRIRSEYAEALKRASLERQLNKVEPNTLQDILEQAIEPWLKSNGYIQ